MGRVGSTYAPSLDLNTDLSWLLARRATFVPRKWTVAEIQRAGGPTAWLDKQLNPSSINDALYRWEQQHYFPDYMLNMSQFKAKWLTNSVVMNHWHIYMVKGYLHECWRSKHQLKMRMMEFWFDHLSVNRDKIAHSVTSYIHEVRKSAFEPYHMILRNIYATAGMNNYLDNTVNFAPNVNQNLARELLELHTVGAGNFTQNDMLNVARLMSGRRSQADGTTRFDPKLHHKGTIKILGWTSPNTGTTHAAILSTVNSFLNYIARHPATARRLIRRLVTKFVTEKTNIVLENRLVDIYLRNGLQIKPVLRALFLSKEFANSTGEKVIRPQEMIIRILMHGPTNLTETAKPLPSTVAMNGIYHHLRKSGNAPLGWQFPDGYPLTSDYWLSPSAMSNMFKLATLTTSLTNHTDFRDIDWNESFSITPQMTYEYAIRKIVYEMTGFQPNTAFIDSVARVWYSREAPGLRTKLIEPRRTMYAVFAIVSSPYFLVS